MNTDPKKVISLVEEMTRAEIMARLGSLDGTDWFSIFIKKKNELQEYLFGSSEYIILGIRWGILGESKKQKKQYREEDLEL